MTVRDKYPFGWVMSRLFDSVKDRNPLVCHMYQYISCKFYPALSKRVLLVIYIFRSRNLKPEAPLLQTVLNLLPEFA